MECRRVRFGSFASILACPRDVCFPIDSDQVADMQRCRLRARRRHAAPIGIFLLEKHPWNFSKTYLLRIWGAMKLLRRRFLQLATFATALTIVTISIALLGEVALSQTNRTIKIIVPFPAGGVADILARLLGEQITKAQGPTVLIDNRPGAGASIGYDAAARAAPVQGNTLVIVANSIVINPLLKKTTYDPLNSYEAVCNLVSSPLLFVVNSASPYRTLSDLIAAARAKPGELTLASTGPGDHPAYRL